MIKVTVPATSANIGAGFDSLGLALGMTCRQTFTTRYYAGDMRHYLYAIDAPPQ